MNQLEIKNLNVSIDGQAILKDFSLTIPKGEVHALMGPNGTGKSTLAKVIAGHEDYTVESGEILLDGENILGQEPDEIAKAGMFLAFQYPLEIPGVSIANFIRAARQARLPEGEEINAVEYYKELYAKMDALKMDRKFTARSLNEGFSGGEKKRCEILQMSMLDPKYCVMDETDSGLDIDALKIVSEGVNMMRSERASSSSPTTNACSTTSCRTSSTSCMTAKSSTPATPNSPRSSNPKATTGSRNSSPPRAFKPPRTFTLTFPESL